MITILALCYAGCVILAFKVIRIKPTPVSIAVSIVIGMFLLGGIIIAWQQTAPISSQVLVRRRVLQVIPDVREFVTTVHAKPNQFVTKGEPLFEISPDRFEDAVQQAAAVLTATKATVAQLDAGVIAAQAAVRRAQANMAAAKAALIGAGNAESKCRRHCQAEGARGRAGVSSWAGGRRAAGSDLASSGIRCDSSSTHGRGGTGQAGHRQIQSQAMHIPVTGRWPGGELADS